MTKNPIVHALAVAAFFAAPLLLGIHGLGDISIGAILTAAWHWAGNYLGKTA